VNIQKVWLSILLTTLSACSTAQTVDNLDYNIAEIKSGLVSFFRGKIAQQVGESRLLMSEPFRPRLMGDRMEPVRAEDEVRTYATVLIVGNEKPYTLEVTVYAQKRVKQTGEWVTESEHHRLAKELSQSISEYLRRNRNKNLIDHFRAF